ncbi:AAHS family 4-hydroxybenzoate transporter-like MFS transporter [Rhizobium sp. PP-F2F-G38]|nr:AAHS family 4-hydroxybenzoate transporter-like MFS transporter [Rhizobium sp. PP-F2F-G38]TCP81585.1 AAHS family 4-hydroxybenzoate transporter-like MFS transporter [Rhizobium sp. PP-CC-2G-626]
MERTDGRSTLRASAQHILDNHPMGRQRWLMLIACFLIIALDGADVQSASFIYPEFVRLWGVEKPFISAIVVGGLIAMVIGASIAGPLADRYGRRSVVGWGVALVSTGTFLGAFAWDANIFLVIRAFTCLGLGAIMPITVALISEFAPTQKRARVVTTVFAGYTAGAAISGYLAAVLIPMLGWRWYLVAIGGLSAVMLPVFLKLVPESIGWLATQRDGERRVREIVQRVLPGADIATLKGTGGERTEAKVGGIKLITSKRYLPIMLGIATCYFIGLAVIYLFQTYFPLVITQSGLQLSQAGILVAAFSVGGVLGALLIGSAMDTFGRFKVLAVAWLIAIPAIWAVAFSTLDYQTLIVLSFIWGILLQGVNSGLNALAATLFPADARATGVSFMHALGRFGAILSGLVGGVAISLGWSIGKIFFILGCPLIVGVAAIIFLSVVSGRKDDVVIEDPAFLKA